MSMLIPRGLFALGVLLLGPGEAAAYFESRAGCASRPFGATRSMALTIGGDAVVTGCLRDGMNYHSVLTMRYDGATGAVKWAAHHHGSGGHSGAAAVAVDPAGDVVVTGYSTEDGKQRIRTIKYEGATGARIWSVAFDAYGSSRANAVAVSAAGHVYVTGESTEPGGSRHMRTIKYDGATGAQSWAVALSGSFPGFHIGQAIVVDAIGNAYVTGLSGEVDFGSNLRTVKYDGQTGAQLWTSHMGVSGDDSGLDAALDPAGNLVVAGYTYEAATGGDYRIVKYDAASGAVLWTRSIAGTGLAGDQANAVAVDPAGDVFVTGLADAGGYNMRTAKLDAAAGAVEWNVATAEDGSSNAYAYSIAVDGGGDVLVTGQSKAAQARTIKYRGADGVQLWSASTSSTIAGLGVAANAARDVLVSGSGFSPDGYGFQVIKYAADTGAEIWASAPTINDIAELAVSQMISPADAARVGKDLVITLFANNSGPAPATNVTLFYTVPVGAELVWVQGPDCTVAAGLVTCAVGTLATSTNVGRVVVIRPTVAGTLNSHLHASWPGPDPIPGNGTLNVPINVTAAAPGTPVVRYRLYSPVTLEHHFTTDANEYAVLGGFVGTWVQEGTVGSVLDNPGSYNGVAAVPYYRLYDTTTRWHHWTTDPNEYYTLIQYPWWTGEGVDGYILPTQAAGTIELYRLNYPFIPGLHHWTTDANEYATLINQYGWIGEPGAGFVVQ